MSEEYYLLGYNAVQSVESQPTFRRNISPPFSGSNKLAACLHAGILLGLFYPEDWTDVPPKRRLTSNGLHGVISQTTLFITTAVRISNPTKWLIFCTRLILEKNWVCYGVPGPIWAMYRLNGIQKRGPEQYSCWTLYKLHIKTNLVNSALFAAGYFLDILFGLNFDPEDRSNIPPKHRLTSTEPQDVISRERKLFNLRLNEMYVQSVQVNISLMHFLLKTVWNKMFHLVYFSTLLHNTWLERFKKIMR
jgi:hypothetical protein